MPPQLGTFTLRCESLHEVWRASYNQAEIKLLFCASRLSLSCTDAERPPSPPTCVHFVEMCTLLLPGQTPITCCLDHSEEGATDCMVLRYMRGSLCQ